ncbi:MAG: RecX family transcriptional regulator [Bacteroidota bacterium]|nr:RecX family transcriptional regulator [Bacteroidota bacterium]
MEDHSNKIKPKHHTVKEAKEKIYHFCSYQERTQKEVRSKLYDYGLKTDDVELIIADLVTDNFINEERFAIAFAGGKFRIKKWGRLKIHAALKVKGISDYCMKQALKSIDEEDYHIVLCQLLEKKSALEKEKNVFIRKDKIAKFAISKGFEPDIVWSIINENKL